MYIENLVNKLTNLNSDNLCLDFSTDDLKIKFKENKDILQVQKLLNTFKDQLISKILSSEKFIVVNNKISVSEETQLDEVFETFLKLSKTHRDIVLNVFNKENEIDNKVLELLKNYQQLNNYIQKEVPGFKNYVFLLNLIYKNLSIANNYEDSLIYFFLFCNYIIICNF